MSGTLWELALHPAKAVSDDNRLDTKVSDMRREKTNVSSLSGFASAELPRVQRYIANEEVVVNVLNDKDVFERFMSEAYNSLAYRWYARTRSELPFTENEYTRYGYTAVRTRVARVNNERFTVRCDDPWALHPFLAAVLSGVGLVTLETPAITFRPAWLKENDEFLLTKDEQAHLTRRIKSLVDVDGMGFMPILAIGGDRSGLKNVMSLIPVRNALGQVVELKSHYDFEPIAAVAYLISGLTPAAYDGFALPNHPQLMPAFFIEKAVLLNEIYNKMAEIGVGK